MLQELVAVSLDYLELVLGEFGYPEADQVGIQQVTALLRKLKEIDHAAAKTAAKAKKKKK